MKATLTGIGAGMFCGPLEGWQPQSPDDPHELEVYTGKLPDSDETYCAFWSRQEWREMDRVGYTHRLFASGTLRQHDGVWSGELVHIGTRGKVMGWRATAPKGSRTLEFELVA